MTLNEALQIFGLAIIITTTKMEGHEIAGMLVNNAIIEEWLNGDLSAVMNDQIKTLALEYGSNTVRQAARVLANTSTLYEDLR